MKIKYIVETSQIQGVKIGNDKVQINKSKRT